MLARTAAAIARRRAVVPFETPLTWERPQRQSSAPSLSETLKGCTQHRPQRRRTLTLRLRAAACALLAAACALLAAAPTHTASQHHTISPLQRDNAAERSAPQRLAALSAARTSNVPLHASKVAAARASARRGMKHAPVTAFGHASTPHRHSAKVARPVGAHTSHRRARHPTGAPGPARPPPASAPINARQRDTRSRRRGSEYA